MFAAFAKFRTIDRTRQRTIWPRRLATRPMGLVHSNDNRPSARPVVATRSLRQPVLVARWQRNIGSGRLECHWIVETAEGQPKRSGPVANMMSTPRSLMGHFRPSWSGLNARSGLLCLQ